MKAKSDSPIRRARLEVINGTFDDGKLTLTILEPAHVELTLCATVTYDGIEAEFVSAEYPLTERAKRDLVEAVQSDTEIHRAFVAAMNRAIALEDPR